MSERPPMRVRPPKDEERLRAILVGPVHHDPLYRPYRDVVADGIYGPVYDAVLERRSSTRTPRNVAPLVCKISKSGD